MNTTIVKKRKREKKKKKGLGCGGPKQGQGLGGGRGLCPETTGLEKALGAVVGGA